jgi:hypothetical protein
VRPVHSQVRLVRPVGPVGPVLLAGLTLLPQRARTLLQLRVRTRQPLWKA